jgi:UDP-N-acetylglucosamine:LPS N-acetylglucosamine transferase
MKNELDILFFSRGRGRGHAVPDLTILAELRRLRPDVRVQFASYAAGAEVFAAAGEPLVRLDLPEANPFVDTVVLAAQTIQRFPARMVVSHEELAALSAARIHGLPTAFLSHWFISPQDPWVRALRYAGEVLFMERSGLFFEPAEVHGRVRYLGPVLKRFRYRPEDRVRARRELGFGDDESLIVVLPGNPSELNAPICDLVLSAFDLLDRPRKRLVWLAGQDREEVMRRAGARVNVQVIDVDWQLDRLMVGSDVAITKATYNIGRELSVLGIPAIALSHGQNFIDDLYSRTFPNNTFLWAREIDSHMLAGHIEAALQSGPTAADRAALEGAGAAAVAACLAHTLERIDAEEDRCRAVQPIPRLEAAEVVDRPS